MLPILSVSSELIDKILQLFPVHPEFGHGFR